MFQIAAHKINKQFKKEPVFKMAAKDGFKQNYDKLF